MQATQAAQAVLSSILSTNTGFYAFFMCTKPCNSFARTQDSSGSIDVHEMGAAFKMLGGCVDMPGHGERHACMHASTASSRIP